MCRRRSSDRRSRTSVGNPDRPPGDRREPLGNRLIEGRRLAPLSKGMAPPVYRNAGDMCSSDRSRIHNGVPPRPLRCRAMSVFDAGDEHPPAVARPSCPAAATPASRHHWLVGIAPSACRGSRWLSELLLLMMGVSAFIRNIGITTLIVPVRQTGASSCNNSDAVPPAERLHATMFCAAPRRVAPRSRAGFSRRRPRACSTRPHRPSWSLPARSGRGWRS